MRNHTRWRRRWRGEVKKGDHGGLVWKIYRQLGSQMRSHLRWHKSWSKDCDLVHLSWGCISATPTSFHGTAPAAYSCTSYVLNFSLSLQWMKSLLFLFDWLHSLINTTCNASHMIFFIINLLLHFFLPRSFEWEMPKANQMILFCMELVKWGPEITHFLSAC